MSFLGPLIAGLGSSAGAVGGATPAPTAAPTTTGLGRMIGVNSDQAGKFGTAMNGIAQAGGAAPGYAAPEPAPVNNHLQLADPNILQAILQQFRGFKQ